MSSGTGPRCVDVDAAVLTGTVRRPEMELRFEFGDTHATTGRDLLAWVKSRPDRRWDPDNEYGKCWVVTGFGTSPGSDLAAAGFDTYVVDLDQSDPDDPDGPGDQSDLDVDDLVEPIVELSEREGFAVVWPRFLGYDLTSKRLGSASRWAGADEGFFEIPLNRLPDGFDIPDDVLAAAAEWTERRSALASRAATVAAAVDMESAGDEGASLADDVGSVPDWFGLDLDGYQVAGALAAASGHTLIADDMGLGKALKNGTPVLTPTGWVPIEDLTVEDEVIGRDGKAWPVEGVFPQGVRPLLEVTFDDGTSIVTDEDHLWDVRPTGSEPMTPFTTMTTADLAASGLAASDPDATGLATPPTSWSLPPLAAVQHPHVELAIDPYVFGVGMCDGFSGNKVPDRYMHASESQRVALLWGMMDVLGFNQPSSFGRPGGTTFFASEHASLTNDVAELTRSLGGVSRRSCWDGPQGAVYLTTVEVDFCPFRYRPKATGWVPAAPERLERTIVGIGYPSSGEATCISVASPDSLFVTQHHIVTHNTRTSLAAAALLGARRTIITVPPVTISGWIREVDGSNLARFAIGDTGDVEDPAADDPTSDPVGGGTGVGEPDVAPPTNPDSPNSGTGTSVAQPSTERRPKATVRGVQYPDGITVYVAGRKERDLPESGVVIVADSLLSSRTELLDRLVAWKADVVIVDESHRAMTWTSARSKALRRLAASSRKASIPLSGTPFFASVVELAGSLAISGHLETVFGGYQSFRSTFARQNHFNAWVTRKSQLPTLYRALNRSVWVRRTKGDVLKDLPAKRRVPLFVDVDLTLFRQAHNEVSEVIDDWLDDWELDHDALPELAEVQAWARSELSLVTRLRRAAGLAKVPAALEYIEEWVDAHSDDESPTFDRPLIVWAHHNDVIDALVEEVGAKYPAARSITGATPHSQRSKIIDDYQAGLIPVLVLSIHAAGVGITLTRGCDALFIETDFTPALVAQAEDRQCRRGQTRPVTCTTLVAPGTLDERIQGVLNRKFEIIGQVLVGADADVAVTEDQADETTAPTRIIVEIAGERLAKRKKKRPKAKKSQGSAA